MEEMIEAGIAQAPADFFWVPREPPRCWRMVKITGKLEYFGRNFQSFENVKGKLWLFLIIHFIEFFWEI